MQKVREVSEMSGGGINKKQERNVHVYVDATIPHWGANSHREPWEGSLDTVLFNSPISCDTLFTYAWHNVYIDEKGV